MAITTIEAAGARSCIARPNCSITPAVRRSLIGSILVASLLVSTDFLFAGLELAALLFALRIIHGAGASCTFLHSRDDRLILAGLLCAPASHLANRLAPPYRA